MGEFEFLNAGDSSEFGDTSPLDAPEALVAAQLIVCGRADNKAEARMLLQMLGLPLYAVQPRPPAPE